MDFDPPLVEFTCDSFSLTSPGTGAEYVLLNPFWGSVEDSVLDNAASSEEGLMGRAMMDASKGIVRKRKGDGGHGRGSGRRNPSEAEDDLPDENSEVIAGEAIHNRFQLDHRRYDTPPRQVLFSVDD